MRGYPSDTSVLIAGGTLFLPRARRKASSARAEGFRMAGDVLTTDFIQSVEAPLPWKPNPIPTSEREDSAWLASV